MLWYRLLYLPALLVLLPGYLFRARKRGGFRQGIRDRFGLFRDVPPRRPGIRRVWIQAVSVGELMAIVPLLKELKAHPQVEVVVTTTTTTGYRVLKETCRETTIWQGYFPMDFFPFSSRAWRRLQPDLAVLMEGELWPEHLHQAWRRGVPVFLINGRISDRSFRRHSQAQGVTRPFLGKLSRILCGSQTDYDRFCELGWIPASRIELVGNLKLDMPAELPIHLEEQIQEWKSFGFLDPDNPTVQPVVLLGSSTWPGEEEALVAAYQELRPEFPALRLLIVPRHAERRDGLKAFLKTTGLAFHFRTEGRQAPEGTDVYVADTTGELKTLTRSAALVFVGKSLPPHAGGQTPIEAALLGKPILLGPDMSNFRDVSRRLVKAGAARRLAGESELVPALKALLLSTGARREMGQRAGAFIAASRGATGRTAARMLEAMVPPREQTPS